MKKLSLNLKDLSDEALLKLSANVNRELNRRASAAAAKAVELHPSKVPDWSYDESGRPERW